MTAPHGSHDVPGRPRLGPVQRRLAQLAIAAALAVTPLATVHEAQAADPVLLPFGGGKSVKIIQGYHGGTHQGRSVFGLDLVLATEETSGADVVAPIGGKVVWAFEPGASAGCIAIAMPSGEFSVNLCHVLLSRKYQSGEQVNRGQVIGKVGAPGTLENNNVSHVHMELHRGAYASDPVPFSPPAGVPLEGVNLGNSDKYSENSDHAPIASTNGPGNAGPPSNKTVSASTVASPAAQPTPAAKPAAPASPQDPAGNTRATQAGPAPVNAAAPAQQPKPSDAATPAPVAAEKPTAGAASAPASTQPAQPGDAATPANAPARSAVVFGTESCLNVREQPAAAATVLDCLTDGTTVALTPGTTAADNAKWRQVEGKGWVSLDYLKPTSMVVSGTGDCLNVREAPSKSAAVVVCLPDGTVVPIQEGPTQADDIDWYRGPKGWVAGEYLD